MHLLEGQEQLLFICLLMHQTSSRVTHRATGLGPGDTRNKTPTLFLQSSRFRSKTVQNVFEYNAAHVMVQGQGVPWELKRRGPKCYVQSVEMTQRM